MLAPWKKSYDKPRLHIKKQRHYFTNKGPSSQSYGFSSSHVRIWELDHKESWAPKNWCFSNPSLLKESNPEYSFEELILKLKLQNFGHLMWRTDSLKKTHWKRCWEGRGRRGRQKIRQLDGIATWWTWAWLCSRSGNGQSSLVCCSPWGHSQSWLSNRTELNLICTNNNVRWIVDLQWKQKVWTSRKKRVYL